MKDIWKKYKISIIFVVYAIASFLLIWLFFLPYRNHVESQADKIQETELENQIFEKKTAKITEMENKYNEYQRNKGKMGRFIKEGEEVDFIKKLESIGEETENKVSLKVLDAENQKNSSLKSEKNKPKEGDIFKDLPSQNFLSLEVSLEGKYLNLINFLKKIENLDFYTNVVSLDLTKAIAEDESGSPASDSVFSSGENPPQEKIEKETLKSVINIIVYKN